MTRNSQHMERLFTLLLSGIYGAVLTWMYCSNAFGFTSGQRTLISLVSPWIQFMILLGGIFLLVLFLVLLFTFKWGGDGHHHDHDLAADECCDHPEHEHHHHDHEHAHDHNHDHAPHHAHAHDHAHADGCCDHGHEHGWNPIRYIPLLVPVILYLMGLPTDDMIRNFERNLASKVQGASADFSDEEAKENIAALSRVLTGTLAVPNQLAPTADLTGAFTNILGTAVAELDDSAPGEPAFYVDLGTLEKIAQDARQRAELIQRRKVEIDGMFQLEGSVDGGGTLFRIIRLRMACCLGDATPASVACFTKRKVDPKLLPENAGKEIPWARVHGKIRFVRGKSGKYEAIMKASRVEWIPKPPFPYIT